MLFEIRCNTHGVGTAENGPVDVCHGLARRARRSAGDLARSLLARLAGLQHGRPVSGAEGVMRATIAFIQMSYRSCKNSSKNNILMFCFRRILASEKVGITYKNDKTVLHRVRFLR